MEVVVQGENIGMAIQELKKKILRDGIFREIKDRQECKPSIKKRDKQRRAERRRKKSQVRQSQGGNPGADTLTNCQWRFVHTDGEYLKVRVNRGGLHQTGIV